MRSRHFVVAMTGASGAVYGVSVCRELLRAGFRISLLITAAGEQVLAEECGLDWQGGEAVVARKVREYFEVEEPFLSYYAADNLKAPVASGSSAADAMIVCPCSMGSLSRVASGNSGNLIERCADVALKEGRTLVMVPRETPLNEIHLENLLKLARMGVRIVPAMPAFYHHPQSIDELVVFVVGKVLDTLGIEHALFRRWRSEAGTGN